MTSLLCCLALVALSGDLKPLPEEQQLVESEQIVLQSGRIEVEKLGLIGWTKTTIQRAQMDGTTHYLVYREGEMADFEALRFNTIEMRGLYDADFNVVREVSLEQPLGGDAKPFEVEWGDEGFRWRKGRGRWSPGAPEIRPTAETDIPLFVHGLSVTTPWAGSAFDSKTLEFKSKTLQPAKETTVDGQAVMVFEVDGPTPVRHRLGKDGAYLESQLDRVRLVAVSADEDSELDLRRELADNATFEQVIDRGLPTYWSEKKGTFTNSTLEMSLKLPKGWSRAPEGEVDGTHFRAYPADVNAYVSLEVAVLGTGYTLEDWSAGLLNVYTEIAVDGEVKTKTKSFAKQDAFIIEYLQAGEAQFATTVYAWKRDGFGFLLKGGVWDKGPKKLQKETASLLKSVKFLR